MKTFKVLLCIIFPSVLFLMNCEKEKDDPNPLANEPALVYPTVNFNVLNISSTMFTGEVEFSVRGTAKYEFLEIKYGTSGQFETSTIVQTESGGPPSNTSKYFTRIKGLSPDVNYSARLLIHLEDTTIYSDVLHFKTLPVRTWSPFARHPRGLGGTWISPKLAFSKNNKGYAFFWPKNASSLLLCEYNPETENWEDYLIENEKLVRAYFTKIGLVSFDQGGRNFVAFGHSGILPDEGMHRSIFEIKVQGGGVAIVELQPFSGTNARLVVPFTSGDRSFLFTMTFTSAAEDSLNIYEFDIEKLLWQHKAAVPSLFIDICTPFAINGNIYLMGEKYGNNLQFPTEYNISSETITVAPAGTFPAEAQIQQSFIYNNKCYYISRDQQNQYLSEYDYLANKKTQLAVYPKTGNYISPVSSSFMIGNVIYTINDAGECFLIEL